MSDQKKTVLITGASGYIGKFMQEGFAGRYHLRLTDNRPMDGVDLIVADIRDLNAMLEVTKGVDAVVHLAAHAKDQDFHTLLLPDNIAGTYNVYEACRQNNVGRIVYASTNHVIDGYTKDVYVTSDMPIRPDSMYAVSKQFGESLGCLFVDNHGMSIVCVRIGSALAEDHAALRTSRRCLSSWLSVPDLLQLFGLCIDTEGLKFEIFHGISGNTRRYWDIYHAQRVLGYQPQDNAERFAAEVEAHEKSQ